MFQQINASIGIREVRQLTGLIKEKHGVDYTEYALTAFKRRVERVMKMHNFTVEALLDKLESKSFLEQFQGQIAVPTTELFRDPTFWVLLKNVYLPGLFKEHGKVRIWIPMCASGEEYYSLSILLKECGWMQQCDIYVSGVSDDNLNSIQKGWLEGNKIEISAKNYLRFQGAAQFLDYYKMSDTDAIFDQSLFANTHFVKQDFEFSNTLPLMHLILFRNQMIYFTTPLQSRVCNILHSRLAVKGLLALGILEEIDLNMISNKFSALFKEESIYQKKA